MRDWPLIALSELSPQTDNIFSSKSKQMFIQAFAIDILVPERLQD